MTKFYRNKKQITNWLDKYNIKNYILIPDKKYSFVVNVDGNVNLESNNLNFIPIKFNETKGNFDCNNNKLTSLEFSPQTVVDNFWCDSNKLTSLEFSPQQVGGSFSCSDNQLTSLEYCPKIVIGYFFCNNNQLESLEFCPQSVLGYFYCDNNPKLQEIQKFIDFNLIYLEHKKISNEKFAKKLDNNLISDNTRKYTKIKI